MTRPCDVLKKADIPTRTLTFRQPLEENSYVILSEPKHCALCARAIRIWKSEKRHTEVRGKKRWTSQGT